jgi:hypothetical protein
MKRALLAILLLGCSDDSSPASQPGVFGGSPPASNADVECTHPGAGAATTGGRCACTTQLAVSGEWSGKRTCREGASCLAPNSAETWRLSQSGTDVTAETDDLRFTGKLCGEFLVWTAAGSNPSRTECGQIRFSDATHFVRDSCYVASGSTCSTNFGRGCPTDKGQCTGTGAKKPDSAASIQKNICD